MAKSYRFIVSGRVQGVFFRQSAVHEAQRLGLSGWVRNLPDGRVEGLASGDAAALEKFRAWLQRGPPSANVTAVEWNASAEAVPAGFTISG
jgi:acylphosphatase